MKTKDCHHFRQGDVLIERIAKIPTAAVKQNKSTRIILAHGEVTGHHHVLEIGDPTDWWKAGEISTASQKPTTLAGELFVSLPSGGVVTHQEHSEIRLCRVGSGCLSINPYALQPVPQSDPCSISEFGLSVGVYWEN